MRQVDPRHASCTAPLTPHSSRRLPDQSRHRAARRAALPLLQHPPEHHVPGRVAQPELRRHGAPAPAPRALELTPPQFWSALFNLLPEAQTYFLHHGLRADRAGLAVVGCFLLGVMGLQLVSELLHRSLPSSIVTCEDHAAALTPEHAYGGVPPPDLEQPHAHAHDHDADESRPLLSRPPPLRFGSSFLGKKHCASGKCYGYSDHPCDQLCSSERAKKKSCECTAAAPSPAPARAAPQHAHAHDRAAASAHAHSHSHDEPDGHHHVAKNKFLSIGVQTSIAIALHKFPEVRGAGAGEGAAGAG